MARGLPEIIIEFKTKASTIINRSQRGIVALILREGEGGENYTFKSIEDLANIKENQLSEDNIDFIKMAFMGVPNKILVVTIPETNEVDDETEMKSSSMSMLLALKGLSFKKWNYLAVPCASSTEVQDIKTFIKEKRDKEGKTFKYISPSSGSDHEGIIDFITTDIVVNKGTDEEVILKTYSNKEYTSRIAGILAGLSLDRSSTYYAFDEIVEIKEHEEPSEEIEKGNLIIISDSENFKIGRGVNSLVTFTTDKGEDFGKIKIVEGVDMIRDDIHETFEKNQIGKIINTYDNKQIFIASINAYFKELQGNVLDPDFESKAEIYFDKQKIFLESKGIDISEYTDAQIKRANTGSKVFIKSNLQFVDAMEDLYMENNM